MAQSENNRPQSSGQFKFDNSAYSNYKYKAPSKDNVPDDVKHHFNWGAFLITFIWGLFNKTYITLLIIPLVFTPIINCIAIWLLPIWFGIKGNEWAWKNKDFDSIEEFHRYQRRLVALGIYIHILIPVVLFTFIYGGNKILCNISNPHSSKVSQHTQMPNINRNVMRNQVPLKETSSTNATLDNQDFDSVIIAYRVKISKLLKDAWVMNQTMSEDCVPTSTGLAKYFSKRLPGKLENNSILTYDGINYIFTGDGSCEKREICKVTVTFNYNGRKDSADIPVYKNSYGYIHIDSKDMNDYRNNVAIVVEPPKPVLQEENSPKEEDNTIESETQNNENSEN